MEIAIDFPSFSSEISVSHFHISKASNGQVLLNKGFKGNMLSLRLNFMNCLNGRVKGKKWEILRDSDQEYGHGG